MYALSMHSTKTDLGRSTFAAMQEGHVQLILDFLAKFLSGLFANLASRLLARPVFATAPPALPPAALPAPSHHRPGRGSGGGAGTRNRRGTGWLAVQCPGGLQRAFWGRAAPRVPQPPRPRCRTQAREQGPRPSRRWRPMG